jgi:SM-20-related protein
VRTAHAAAYARHGRVSVDNFLVPDAAAELRRHLLAREDWLLVLNGRDKVYEIPCSQPLDLAQQRKLDELVGRAALQGFQFRYETVRVPDDPAAREASVTYLNRFAQFLCAPATMAFFQWVTGAPVRFVDAQATTYRPGHFLTRHDDDVEGKNRLAAYVLGLTPDWRADWGGLLLFHAEDETIGHGFVPAFNSLRLFRVPVQHSVTYVTPSAPTGRLSVTGWLRGQAPGSLAKQD